MKLLEIFAALSTVERRRLKEALQSPFFNKNKKLLKCYLFIESNNALYANPDMLKQRLFKKLFPQKNYDDLVVRHLLSKLKKLMEETLGLVQLQSQGREVHLGYLSWLGDRNLSKQYEQFSGSLASQGKQAEESLEAKEFENRLMLQQMQFSTRYETRSSNKVLQQVSDTMDEYFIVSKLKTACAALSLETMYRSRFRIRMIEEVAALMENKPLASHLSQLYFLGFQTFQSDRKEEAFAKLKKTLIEGEYHLAKREKLDLFILAQNFCIRQVNSGSEAYFRELFSLYLAELEQELIQDDPVQFAPTYKNIISVGLRLKELKWIEQFIRDYTAYLEKDVQQDYLNYNLARVHFEREDFERSLDHLNELAYKDFFIILNARMLLLKTYYELDHEGLLTAQMDSFRQYLRRKEVMAYHKGAYLNNLKFIKYLMNLNVYDKARRQKLKEQIEREKALTEKTWLLQKIDQTGR